MMKQLTFLLPFIMMIGSQVSARGITVKYDYDCSHWAGARGGSYMSEPIQNFLVGLLDGLALGTGNDIWGSKGGLQYHRKRVEAGFVVSGKLIIRLGLKRQIEERVLTAGDWFIFEPGVVHQEEAIEDTVIIECSTPWINDRVRVEKYYGIDSNEGLPSTEPGTEKLL